MKKSIQFFAIVLIVISLLSFKKTPDQYTHVVAELNNKNFAKAVFFFTQVPNDNIEFGDTAKTNILKCIEQTINVQDWQALEAISEKFKSDNEMINEIKNVLNSNIKSIIQSAKWKDAFQIIKTVPPSLITDNEKKIAYDSIVAGIMNFSKAKYKEINSKAETYKRVLLSSKSKVDYYESTIAFVQDGKYPLFNHQEYFEGGVYNIEYYLYQSDIFFVFENTGEMMNSVNISEERYYFNKGCMILWLSGKGKHKQVDYNTRKFKSKEKEILENVGKLIEKAEKKEK